MPKPAATITRRPITARSASTPPPTGSARIFSATDRDPASAATGFPKARETTPMHESASKPGRRRLLQASAGAALAVAFSARAAEQPTEESVAGKGDSTISPVMRGVTGYIVQAL